MTDLERRINSCIDHINTAVDVDPWAQELATKALMRMKNELHPGTWKVYETADTEEGQQPVAWECSQCGVVVEYKYKFCPECGSMNGW